MRTDLAAALDGAVNYALAASIAADIAAATGHHAQARAFDAESDLAAAHVRALLAREMGET